MTPCTPYSTEGVKYEGKLPMVGVEHVGGVEPQLTFSKSESELLKMMRAVKVVTDHFHPWLMNVIRSKPQVSSEVRAWSVVVVVGGQ